VHCTGPQSENNAREEAVAIELNRRFVECHDDQKYDPDLIARFGGTETTREVESGTRTMVARMPMMEITTRSSMMVNAFANRVPIVWRIGYVTQDDILFPLVRYRLHGRRERVWRCLGSQQTTKGIVAMSRDKTQP
jgi:hypothetical protein